MQVFFQVLGILLILSPDLKAADSHDLGQWRLRDELQESFIRTENLPRLYQAYGLDGSSEWVWYQISKGGPEIQPEGDLLSGFGVVRHHIDHHPQRLIKLFDLFGALAQEAGKRPIDAIASGLELFQNFFLPLTLGLLLLFLFQLNTWATAIRRDIYRAFSARSPLVVRLGLPSLILLTWLSREILLGLLLLSLLCVIYSRRNQFYIFVSAILCLSLFGSPFISHFRSEVQTQVALEALQVGRNRVEYSDRSLSQLEPIQQASWAHWNLDGPTALNILSQQADSKDKLHLQAVVQLNPQNFSQTTDKLDQILKQYGSDHILLFNLSQLLLRTQDLVRAEEIRRQIPKDVYDKLLERASKSDRIVLAPQQEPNFSKEFYQILRQTYSFLLPNIQQNLSAWIKYLLHLFIFLLPILLISLALLFRKLSSGLCQETGEATSGVNDNLSKLAYQVHQRSEDLDSKDKQKYLQLHRYHEQNQTDRSKFWSWLYPGTYFAANGYYFVSFFLSFIVYFILWVSLPINWRMNLHHSFGFQEMNRFYEVGFSWAGMLFGFFVYGCLIFIIRKRLN